MTGAIEGYRSPSACTDPQIPRQDGCVLFNTFFFFFFFGVGFAIPRWR